MLHAASSTPTSLLSRCAWMHGCSTYPLSTLHPDRWGRVLVPPAECAPGTDNGVRSCTGRTLGWGLLRAIGPCGFESQGTKAVAWVCFLRVPPFDWTLCNPISKDRLPVWNGRLDVLTPTEPHHCALFSFKCSMDKPPSQGTSGDSIPRLYIHTYSALLALVANGAA